MNLSISAPGHDYEANPSNGWPNGNNQRIHSLTNPCILTKRISGPPNQLTEQIKANTCWTNRYAYQCRKNWVTKFKWKIIFALSNVHRFYSAIQARGGNFVCVYICMYVMWWTTLFFCIFHFSRSCRPLFSNGRALVVVANRGGLANTGDGWRRVRVLLYLW